LANDFREQSAPLLPGKNANCVVVDPVDVTHFLLRKKDEFYRFAIRRNRAREESSICAEE
jgi:hypothetical protein